VRRERLITARKVVGKSQEDVAEAVGVDRTTIGTWERGERTPQPSQRAPYAVALGVSMSELDAMLSNIPTYAEEMPDWLSTYLGLEQSATKLLDHCPGAVHGLLQTPAYTEHVVRHVSIAGVPESYVHGAIEQRRHRQKRVGSGDLTLDIIQPEHAFQLRVGDSKVMATQLRTMVELAELPNVTVRVTLNEMGQHEALRLGAFGIMEHPWGSPRAHLVEGYGGGRFITDADEVAYLRAVFDHAAGLALSPKDSVAFIQQQAEQWEARE
jgi:transcriptional regulator with XRE-family HTH domain